MLDMLDSVEGTIRELGSDRVRGDDVQGVGFTVSTEEIWSGRKNVPEAMTELEVPAEAWLDGQGRLRRVVMEIDLDTASEAVREQEASDSAATKPQRAVQKITGAMAGTVVVTTEFYDFGTAVTVQLPDSSEVMSAEEFERRMRGN